MRRALLLSLLLLAPLIAWPAAVQAQTARKKAIVGSVKAKFRGLRAPDYVEVMEGTVRFEHWMASPAGGDLYKMTEGAVVWSASGNGDDCAFSGGPLGIGLDSLRDMNVFTFDAQGRYSASLSVGAPELAGQVTAECDPGGTINANPILIRPLETGTEPWHPETDGSLKGFYTNAVPGAVGVTEWEWNLKYEKDSLKLVVDVGEYGTWLPRPGEDEYSNGNVLTVTAAVVNADGTPAAVKPAEFTFRLAGTSREPGIALNYPAPDLALTTPDLRWVAASNETYVDPDSQVVTAGPREEGSHIGEARIGAFDGGAFAMLIVSVQLEDGRTLVGKLEAWGGLEEIPVPRRFAQTKIGDPWRAENAPHDEPDDEDADALPIGDEHDGDGLTLYEEYRGFIVAGRHVRTNPTQKTLFIYDKLGGPVKQGIALYETLTGLEVYRTLDSTEIDPAVRVVNFNHAQGDHVVDQHALYLKSIGGGEGVAVGGPGTPKAIQYIDLPLEPGYARLSNGRRRVRTSLLSHYVAHELLHGANVHHHGNSDLRDVEWALQREPSGRPVEGLDGFYIVEENGARIVHPMTERGQRRIPVELALTDTLGIAIIGMPHGEHSGVEHCVMRYHVAPFYGRSPESIERYWTFQDELPGIGLCQTYVGTGVNAASRRPQARYDDADHAQDRGNCEGQLCVNDRYH